jgi:hypothetical protein
MSYSIIFGGKSSNNKNIFGLQIKLIRIMTNSRNKYSCRVLFKKLRILQFYSQFIYSLITFVLNSCVFYIKFCAIHNNTRYKNNLHLPYVSLSMYWKGVYYSGIKIFNNFRTSIKILSYTKTQFMTALKDFLVANYFCLWKNILVINLYKDLGFLILCTTIGGF